MYTAAARAARAVAAAFGAATAACDRWNQLEATRGRDGALRGQILPNILFSLRNSVRNPIFWRKSTKINFKKLKFDRKEQRRAHPPTSAAEKMGEGGPREERSPGCARRGRRRRARRARPRGARRPRPASAVFSLHDGYHRISAAPQPIQLSWRTWGPKNT